MLDILIDKIKGFFSSRLFPIAIIYVVLLLLVIHKLFVLQIVEGTKHVEKIDFKTTKNREIKSTRGNIYDRNGNLLAYNELSYALIIEDSTKVNSNKERNEIIHEVIQILESNGDSLDNEFYITQNRDGDLKFTISGNELLRFKKKVYEYTFDKDNRELTQEQIDATADEVFEFLRYGQEKLYTMFDIDEIYTIEETLKIMGVRFSLFDNFPKYKQITLATNISEETAAAILEQKDRLSNLEIKPQTHRIYNDGLYFSHIMGYTGLASSQEIETLNVEAEEYNSTDAVGKSGIEKEFESYLKGEKGNELVTVNTVGKVIEVSEINNPLAGNDVYLTIDRDLQIHSYKALEKKIAGVLLSKITPNMNYGSKGESADDILIPIYEVYFALINNNIIDLSNFKSEKASNLEKTIYSKYKGHLQTILKDYDKYLSPNNSATNKESGDVKDYLDYFYKVIKDNEILDMSMVDTSDSVYISYVNNGISLNKFIHHTIANNWINLSKLGVGDEYYTTEEIYKRLMDHTLEILVEDLNFMKMIYRDLVFSYKLTGTEICLLLFEQDVIKYNESDVNKLKVGAISAYTFITKHIKNLNITPAMLALEPCSGSLVVSDVNTGDVLALVSYPSYDNNMFANKIDAKYYSALLNDRATPLNNRPTSERIAPGSTYKMVSTVAAIEEGAVGMDETINDLGIFTKVTPEARCHRYPSSHGHVNSVSALKVSCNYYFYESAFRMSADSQGKYNQNIGIAKFAKYSALFGLNEKSGIELYEIEPKVSDTDPIRSALGQGNHGYAPIQLSRYVSAVANRGKVFDMTLLGKIVDKDGKVVLNNKPVINNEINNIKESTWDRVQRGMLAATNDIGGSTYNIYRNLDVDVAGKTGTAQQSKSSPNHAIFVSYAPYVSPEVSMVTVIPNGYTSGNAAELTKGIYEYYFDIKDDEELENDEVAPPSNDSIISD